MTPAPARPAWPVITVRLDNDGTAEIDRMGTTHTLTAGSTTAARDQVRTWIADNVARQMDRPVAVTITDPDGTWHVTVDAQAQVAPSDHGKDRTHRARGGEPRNADLPPAPAADHDTEPLTVGPEQIAHHTAADTQRVDTAPAPAPAPSAR